MKAVDQAAGTITLRTHPASAYRRIEVALGKELPDFAYTDFTGKTRRLSDLRGKYVLLDLWATWCAPCIADLPHLKSAYAACRDRRPQPTRRRAKSSQAQERGAGLVPTSA